MKECDVLIKELKMLDREQEYLIKQSTNYQIINKMMSIEGNNIIKNYLKNNNLRNLIIYGAGTIGKILFDIIEKEFMVKAVVDINGSSDFSFNDVDIIHYRDINRIEYDKIIITSIYSYDKIKLSLERENIYNFILISDLISYKYI